MMVYCQAQWTEPAGRDDDSGVEETFIHRSILDTEFICKIDAVATVGNGVAAVIPNVSDVHG